METEKKGGKLKETFLYEPALHFEVQMHIMLHFETHKDSKYLVNTCRCFQCFAFVHLNVRKCIYNRPAPAHFSDIVYMYIFIQYVQCSGFIRLFLLFILISVGLSFPVQSYKLNPILGLVLKDDFLLLFCE